MNEEHDEEDGDFGEHLAAITSAAASTATTTGSGNDDAVVSENVEEKQPNNGPGVDVTYKARTIRPGSVNGQRRIGLLPAYPSASGSGRILLLFSNVANVDRVTCENQSFCGGNGVCPFEFRQHRYVESIDSFMIDFYRHLFIEPSRQWKINHSLIDYNLSRLRQCMDLYTKETKEPALLSFNELIVALEFYLQIDGKRERENLIKRDHIGMHSFSATCVLVSIS
jgi:hypothetical protein